MWNELISDGDRYRVTGPSSLKLVVMTLIGRRDANDWWAIDKKDGSIIKLSAEDHDLLDSYSMAMNKFELTFFPSDGKAQRQPRADAWLAHFLDAVKAKRNGETRWVDKWVSGFESSDEEALSYIWRTLFQERPQPKM